jgi:Rad3-related DNA helicase
MGSTVKFAEKERRRLEQGRDGGDAWRELLTVEGVRKAMQRVGE